MMMNNIGHCDDNDSADYNTIIIVIAIMMIEIKRMTLIMIMGTIRKPMMIVMMMIVTIPQITNENNYNDN